LSTAQPERPQILASDSDRDVTMTALRDHCAAGRLEVSDLEERLTAAAAAQTVGELQALLADLPATASTGDRRPRSPLAPRRFAMRHDFAHPQVVVFDEAVASIVPAMKAAGFAVDVRSRDATLLFERMSASRRARDQFVLVVVEPASSGAVMRVHGLAARRVRHAFASISRG
jgi:hypothetical protein